MTKRLALVLGFAGAAGCGGSDTTVAEVTEELAAAICAYIEDCCSPTQIECTAGHPLGEGDCEELASLALRELTYITDDAVDEGRRTIDEDVVTECKDAIAARSCAYNFNWPDICDDIFPGAQDAGDECFSFSECEAGTSCEYNGYDNRGICVPLQLEDDPCFDHDQCADELYCSADGYVCKTRAADGSGCEPSDGDGVAEAPLCAEGLYCNDEERCQGPGGLGDLCDDGACQPGLVCMFADPNYECVEPLADGEPCFGSFECASGYCDQMGECASDSSVCDVAIGFVGYDYCEP